MPGYAAGCAHHSTPLPLVRCLFLMLEYEEWLEQKMIRMQIVLPRKAQIIEMDGQYNALLPIQEYCGRRTYTRGDLFIFYSESFHGDHGFAFCHKTKFRIPKASFGRKICA